MSGVPLGPFTAAVADVTGLVTGDAVGGVAVAAKLIVSAGRSATVAILLESNVIVGLSVLTGSLTMKP